MLDNNKEHRCSVTVVSRTTLVSFIFVLCNTYIENEAVLYVLAYLHICFHKRRRLKFVTASGSNNATEGFQCPKLTKALLSQRALLSIGVHDLMCRLKSSCHLLSRTLTSPSNLVIRPFWLHLAQMWRVRSHFECKSWSYSIVTQLLTCRRQLEQVRAAK